MSEKKMPMESGMPTRLAVARMPEATPRWRAGTLFMMAAVLGAANMPKASAVQEEQQGEQPVGEVGRQGHQQTRKLAAASSMPPVANGRAP